MNSKDRFVVMMNWALIAGSALGMVTLLIIGNYLAAIWAFTCLIQTIHNQDLMYSMKKTDSQT